MRVQLTPMFDFTQPTLYTLGGAYNWLLNVVLSVSSGEASSSNRSADASEASTGEFQHLILPHLDAAYSLARYLTRDAIAAEDIVQDAYLKAFQSFSGFRGGNPRSWILAIVRNAVRDWKSSQQNERRFIATCSNDAADDGALSVDAMEAIADEVESVESRLVRGGEDRRVRAIIERIPENLREILILREMDDLSYREIAAITLLPLGTVMSRLARARDAFATIWRRLEEGNVGNE